MDLITCFAAFNFLAGSVDAYSTNLYVDAEFEYNPLARRAMLWLGKIPTLCVFTCLLAAYCWATTLLPPGLWQYLFIGCHALEGTLHLVAAHVNRYKRPPVGFGWAVSLMLRMFHMVAPRAQRRLYERVVRRARFGR